MRAILEPNGDLLVPIAGGCVAARRLHPDDPDYTRYRADAIPADALEPEPGEDERLAAELFGPQRRTA